MILNDPKSIKKGFFEKFISFSAAAITLKVNCVEIAGKKPRQLAYRILALNANFSSLRPDPLGSRKPLQAGVKKGHP